jgi:hypothetical protein
MTQYQKLAKLLTRKKGVTAFEIILQCGSVCPHKRLSDMKAQGWTITRKQIDGKSYGAYFGKAPKV